MDNKTKKTRGPKPLFIVDLLMALFALLTLLTGIGNHLAGHSGSHGVWHVWSALHILAALIWSVVTVIHCKHHWAWYKSLLAKRPSNVKSKVTMLLTLVFLFTALSGIYLLLFADGEGTIAGVRHYVGGLLLGAIALGHLLKRFRILRKGLGAR